MVGDTSGIVQIKNPMNQQISLKKRVYELIGPYFQATVDHLRYATGLLPRVDPTINWHEWLPKPYRSALVISADFELGWAWRYARGIIDPLIEARNAAQQTRSNLPDLLELFDRYNVPVTWATVGHLFLDHCECINGKAHPDLLRPPYFENEYWNFQAGDWYDADPCSTQEKAPDWYAPDLINSIRQARPDHEIACHTFSHIDCSENNCPPELLESELAECCRVALKQGITLKSIVFPGCKFGNFGVLQKMGFKAYRWHNNFELGIPQLDTSGLWRIPGGVFWEKPDNWSPAAWISATRLCIDRAIETKTLMHFWFHPSCAKINILQTFPNLLEYVKKRRDDIWVVTMGELAEYLNNRSDTNQLI